MVSVWAYTELLSIAYASFQGALQTSRMHTLPEKRTPSMS